MTVLRMALLAACFAVLASRTVLADEPPAETAATPGTVAPVPATLPLPPPLPPGKTAVAAVNG